MNTPGLRILGLWLLLSAAAIAQESNDFIALYIDCADCDLDFFKTELTFVNHVRDRGVADVHLLIVKQNTGGGGTEYCLIFIGKRNFAGCEDTLRHVAQDSDTADMIRQGLLRVAKLGLTRFVAHTSAAANLSVDYQVAAEEQAPTRDKWNYWVFQVSGSGYFNGEKSFHTAYLYGEVNARRVTEEAKYGFSVYGSHNRDRYDLGDVVVKSNAESEGFDCYALFALNGHWSAGGEFNVYRSSFSNRDVTAVTEAAVEYDIFPYSQSTYRQLRIQYQFKHVISDYREVTIYEETRESRLLEAIEATLEFTQPWGSAEVSLYGSHYFHDFEKNRVQFYGEVSLRVISGLSVDIYGNVSRIHDLISLEKGEASDEEILLRRRQVETSYSYYTSIGLSYTFGSIYNNIVNPRFGN